MDSYKVVLANGVFDILHAGHYLYLAAAAQMGDRLVVAVTRDKYVNKGPHRPTNPQDERILLIRALRVVDQAILCDDSLDALDAIKPSIFVKGADYIGKIEKRHADYCKAHGIEIRFTDTPIYSATKIINDRARHG